MLLCIIGRTYDEVKTAKQDHAEDRMAHEFRQGLKGSRSRLFIFFRHIRVLYIRDFFSYTLASCLTWICLLI